MTATETDVELAQRRQELVRFLYRVHHAALVVTIGCLVIALSCLILGHDQVVTYLFGASLPGWLGEIVVRTMISRNEKGRL